MCSYAKGVIQSKHERNGWCSDVAVGRHRDKRVGIEQRFDSQVTHFFARKFVTQDIHNLSIKSKFLQLGYETNDVDNVRWERECQQSAPLTDRSKLQ